MVKQSRRKGLKGWVTGMESYNLNLGGERYEYRQRKYDTVQNVL